MHSKVKVFFDRARSDRLEELVKEHEKEFNFNLGSYFFPAIVLATIGCLFFHQAFWFACISIGILHFTALLKQIHDLEDKNAYEEFLDICVRKEGIVFSIIMMISYSILSITSIILLNYMPTILNYINNLFNHESNIFDGLILFLFSPLMLGITIMVTSIAIFSIARLVVPLVIKKSRLDDFHTK